MYDVTRRRRHGSGGPGLVPGVGRRAWRLAAQLANVAGGLEVEKLGVAPVSRSELLAELTRRPRSGAAGSSLASSTPGRAGGVVSRPGQDRGAGQRLLRPVARRARGASSSRPAALGDVLVVGRQQRPQRARAQRAGAAGHWPKRSGRRCWRRWSASATWSSLTSSRRTKCCGRVSPTCWRKAARTPDQSYRPRSGGRLRRQGVRDGPDEGVSTSEILASIRRAKPACRLETQRRIQPLHVTRKARAARFLSIEGPRPCNELAYP